MAGLQFVPNADALSRSIEVFVNETMSPAVRAGLLAKYAIADRDRLISTGRASPIYRVWVDGREGAPETSVEPDGQIYYQFSYTAEAVLFAISFLKRRVPFREGKLRNGFWMAIDGDFISSVDQFNPDNCPPEAEVVIGNHMPYNRKADVQLVGNKKLSFNEPPFFYKDCVRALQIRFGASLKAKRVYTYWFPGQYILKGTKRRGKRVHSPVIIINPKGD